MIDTVGGYLEGDILEEGVLQDGLELPVDLQGELQRHGRVCHPAGVDAGHDPGLGTHHSLGTTRNIQLVRYGALILTPSPGKMMQVQYWYLP